MRVEDFDHRRAPVRERHPFGQPCGTPTSTMTTAKRHHTVPRMLLRRFSSEPRADNPEVWGLDILSGTPYRARINNEAVIRHYYRFEDPKIPIAPSQAEQWLSRIESDAVVPIRKLVDGTALTALERESMAFFLHVTQRRTPQSRAWHAHLDEQMYTEFLKAQLSNPEYIRKRYKDHGDFQSDEEIERWRIETLSDLETGVIGVESGQNREVAYMFLAADKIVAGISNSTTWWSLRAPPGAGFICSDNPLNIYDPGAPNRPKEHAGVGWVSSIAVEATLPLDPRVCLLLTPGPPTSRIQEVDAERVAEINLRTYAAAQQFIYGPSQQAVQEVRKNAKRNRARIEAFRPRPPQFTMIETVQGDDQPRFTTYRPASRSFTHSRKK